MTLATHVTGRIRFWPRALDIVHRWRWRQSALAVLVGAGTLVYNGTPLAYWSDPSIREVIRVALFNILQFGFPLIFTVQMADRAIDGGARPLRSYATAVVATGLAGVWPLAILLRPFLDSGVPWGVDDDVRLMLSSLPFHGLCVGAYAKWRGERIARARLHAVERERATGQRRLDTSRLLALQAKVEPQLLFDALGRIDAALIDDAEVAERRLADLIGLLRAMQPGLRDRASTLGRELALIEAHARVAAEPGRETGRLALEVSPDAARSSFAPLVLLPLMRWLVAVRPARWRLEAAVSGGRLQVDLALLGSSAPEPAASSSQPSPLAELRERLVAVHGPDARLLANDSLTRLQIEVDAEHDAHSHR
jgi:hypothetical protein